MPQLNSCLIFSQREHKRTFISHQNWFLPFPLSLSLAHPAVMSSYNFFIFSHFPSFCSLFSAIQPLTHPPTSFLSFFTTLHSHLCYFAILPFSIHIYSPKYYLSHHYQNKYKKNIVLYVLEREKRSAEEEERRGESERRRIRRRRNWWWVWGCM